MITTLQNLATLLEKTDRADEAEAVEQQIAEIQAGSR